MLSLIIAVLAVIAAGAIVWGTDKHHTSYGAALPAGLGVAVACVCWMVVIALGFGYQPGLTWIPWVLPIVLGTAAAVAVVVPLRKQREASDRERLTAILRA
ncbi:hypothetical protein ACQR35_03015 [Pseudarthrobacter sp. J1738]|uniref:hypothetical protein n=1 Tax=unclassified Pseudarthrobacter TaxID=2647000 RepID=UPI003D2ADB01